MPVGWIEWKGGECPVGDFAGDVGIRLRNGEEDIWLADEIDDLDWSVTGSSRDIIAYRITKES